MMRLLKAVCALIMAFCLTVIPVRNAFAAAPVPTASEVPAEAMHAFIQSIIDAVTTGEMTKEQKLRACYEYCLDLITYQRDNAAPVNGNTKGYALEAFYTGRGNCYRYACAFAFLADELGYETRICVGDCISSQGGWTPHGWCEIKDENGNWRICDLSFGDANRGKRNFFCITSEQHPRALRVDRIWLVNWQ